MLPAAPSFRGRLSAAAVSAALLMASGPIGAQVTTTSDSDPPPDGALRFEIEASAPGDTILFQIPDSGSVSLIDLRTGITFDNDVTLDNSNPLFSLIDIDAPEVDSFLEIEDFVDLVLRDIGLVDNRTNNSDGIVLQGVASTITFDVERADQQVQVDIVGAGSVVKDGAASLELGGDNTFTGSLTILDGDVIGDLQSLSAPTIVLAPDDASKQARLIFDVIGLSVLDAAGPNITDASTNGGVVEFTKRGRGTLEITEANIASTIGFHVERGTLLAGRDNLQDGHDFDIDPGASLAVFMPLLEPFVPPVDSSSDVRGGGSFTTDWGSMTLRGDWSEFTGLLDITGSLFAGSFIAFDPDVAPGALSFDVEIDGPDSRFVLFDDDGLVFSGNLEGTGGFVKAGAGVTELTGVFSHTGGTSVIAGTLRGTPSNLQGDIALSDATTLSFSHAADATYTGTISSTFGTAMLEKFGSGVLTLAQAQTFAGNANIANGGVYFSTGASLANAGLTIGSGGAGARVSLGADFDPAGAATNTIAIGGALSIGSDAEVTVGIAGAANRSTRYAATGAVTIQSGALLNVNPSPGEFVDGLTFDVITGSSVTAAPGAFTIEQSLFFFDILGGVVGNAYQLSLSDNGNTFAAAATNGNQQVIADQLDLFRGAPNGGDPDISAYQGALSSARSDEIGSILDSVSPDDLAAPIQLQLAQAGRTWRGLSNRLALHRAQSIGHHDRFQKRREAARREAIERRRNRGRGVRPPVRANRDRPREQARADASLSPYEQRRGPWVAWIEGSGVFGELDASDANGVDYVVAGPILGADRAIAENVRVGFALSGHYDRYETSQGDNTGEGGAVEGTLYGAWTGDPVEVLFGARYAHAWVETERLLSVGSQSGVADAEFEGDVYGAYLELTRSFEWPGAVRVAPLASVAFTHLAWGDFEEGGAVPLRVQVEEQEVDSVETSLGFRISTEREMDDGIMFRPRLAARWNHEWADVERDVTGSFASNPTTGLTAFTVSGAEIPRDLAQVSVGWEVGYVAAANLFVEWEGRFGADLLENSVSAGLRVAW